MKKIINFAFAIPRFYKRIISVLIDTMFITIAFLGAYIARLGYFPDYKKHEIIVFIAVLIFTLIVFIYLGLYRAVLRYISFHVFISLFLGATISAISVALFSFFIGSFMPRSVPIIYGAFVLILCGGSRLLIRSLIAQKGLKDRKSVLIYGAGASGRQLELALKQGKEYHPIAFIDDDSKLWGSVIQGITVYSPDNMGKLIVRHEINKILLAFPSANREQRKKIIQGLATFKVDVLSIPGMSDIISGQAQIDQLRNVPIEELLGRDAINPQQFLMQRHIKNKVVMVTGAGGSIGSELCRQIILNQPKALILFENSEYNLYAIHHELEQSIVNEQLSLQLLPLLGSVLQQNRLEQVMSRFKVDTVYHAAAYKHVPLVEYNVIEGIRNNVFGTLAVAQAAIKTQVKMLVSISTDKAVRPTNVMGASKRFAELILQALAQEQKNTCFCMVRFGNVLGSSGSVVPLFKKQIAEGGPVTITHADITRYFMTIPEASQLVIQASAMGKGGDIFVLDMGDPVKIVDLAYNLVTLSGLSVKDDANPDGDIEIQYLGLRPGEKLYEELLIGDDVLSTDHPRIMVAREQMLPWIDVNCLLQTLNDSCERFDYQGIRQLLLAAPLAFNPTDETCDLMMASN